MNLNLEYELRYIYGNFLFFFICSERMLKKSLVSFLSPFSVLLQAYKKDTTQIDMRNSKIILKKIEKKKKTLKVHARYILKKFRQKPKEEQNKFLLLVRLLAR